MALYETIMVKGYQTLIDPDTKVDVNTAMIAAGRLQSLLDARSGQPDMVDIMVKQNRIIDVVKYCVGDVLATAHIYLSMNEGVLAGECGPGTRESE